MCQHSQIIVGAFHQSRGQWARHTITLYVVVRYVKMTPVLKIPLGSRLHMHATQIKVRKNRRDPTAHQNVSRAAVVHERLIQHCCCHLCIKEAGAVLVSCRKNTKKKRKKQKFLFLNKKKRNSGSITPRLVS